MLRPTRSSLLVAFVVALVPDRGGAFAAPRGFSRSYPSMQLQPQAALRTNPSETTLALHRLSVAGEKTAHAVQVTATPRSAPPRRGGRGYPVKVYFSRHPASDVSPSAVFAVTRLSPTRGVAAFALGQLIAGPTAAEARAGDYSVLAQYSHGRSACGAPGFALRLNRRGPAVERGSATVQFCYWFMTAGIGADARIIAEIRATLLQFPTIRRVVILTPGGTCFGAMDSGGQACLQPGPPMASAPRVSR